LKARRTGGEDRSALATSNNGNGRECISNCFKGPHALSEGRKQITGGRRKG